MTTKLTMTDFEKLMAARRIARAGRQEDRDRLAVAGLRVYAKRFTDAGDPVTGKRLADAADKCTDFLKRYEAAKAIGEKPVQDYIGQAAIATGKALFKLLPEAFSSAEGAACWAQGALPLADARAKHDEAQASRRKQARVAGNLHGEFVQALEKAGMECCSTIEPAKAIRELVSLGRG